MNIEEREPEFLIANGLLERIEDFDYEGRRVLASRLGYRITSLFAERFLGRIFETPDSVLTEEFLRPEKQDLAQFVTGVDAIVESQTWVAKLYFEDGSVNAACPPIKALLHIMAEGHYNGLTADSPEFRGMFTLESLLASDWYQERLRTKQQGDIALWKRHVASLQEHKRESAHLKSPRGFDVEARLAQAKSQLARVSAPEYLEELKGTLGTDPHLGRA